MKHLLQWFLCSWLSNLWQLRANMIPKIIFISLMILLNKLSILVMIFKLININSTLSTPLPIFYKICWNIMAFCATELSDDIKYCSKIVLYLLYQLYFAPLRWDGTIYEWLIKFITKVLPFFISTYIMKQDLPSNLLIGSVCGRPDSNITWGLFYISLMKVNRVP